MSFTLTLERSLKPRDKSMTVNCESYYMTWKCVTTYTGVYWIWEIISLKALFKVKLSWQMQSFKCSHFRRDESPRRNSTPRSARARMTHWARRVFTDTSFQFLVLSRLEMSRLETYRWELSSSFCVGVSIIFDSFIEVGDAGEWYA